MEKIIKIFKAEVKSIDVAKKRAVVVISTDKKDRDGDIIPPDAFKKNIKGYKDHPILLSSHNYGTLTSQIGQAHNVKINDKDVEADFEWFAGTQGVDGKSMNPEADWGWYLAQKGIAAFSIGFQGLAFDWIEEPINGDKNNTRITGRKFNEIALMEVSQVLVPSNSSALQNSVNNAYTTVVEKEMCELVLKGLKDGSIKSVDFSCKATKKDDNSDISALTTRMDSIQKCMDEMKSNHADMSARLSSLEATASGEIEPDGDDPHKGKKHYTRKLLGADGHDHTQTPSSDHPATEKTVAAIAQAFK